MNSEYYFLLWHISFFSLLNSLSSRKDVITDLQAFTKLAHILHCPIIPSPERPFLFSLFEISSLRADIANTATRNVCKTFYPLYFPTPTSSSLAIPIRGIIIRLSFSTNRRKSVRKLLHGS